jgi:hypothetical protein
MMDSTERRHLTANVVKGNKTEEQRNVFDEEKIGKKRISNILTSDEERRKRMIYSTYGGINVCIMF